MPPAPLKLLTHNHLLSQADGGETAFEKAKEMGISILRYDFRWHQLASHGGWQWNTGGTKWDDLLDPSLKWTKVHGMQTLINLLAYSVPPGSLTTMNQAWQQAGGSGDLGERDCALWAAWAEGNGIDLGTPSPKAYVEALIDRLALGQTAGDYDVVGFCVLNEPNTKGWPAEPNWRSLEMPSGPGGAYTTTDYCNDMCNWVKDHIDAHHQAALGHTVNVVNLYSYRGHWRDEDWQRVARNQNVDVLGIDIYWDQLFGLFAMGVPEAMKEISRQTGKPWWLVETAGAHNPGHWLKSPSCRRIRRYTKRCQDNGASVLGYYRLWGDYSERLNYGAAYNIFIGPGQRPTPTKDCRGETYWETVRDL